MWTILAYLIFIGSCLSVLGMLTIIVLKMYWWIEDEMDGLHDYDEPDIFQ